MAERVGVVERRYVRLLQCQWLLHFETMVIQYLGDYSGLVHQNMNSSPYDTALQRGSTLRSKG
jgi:hypothetical protein